MSPNEAPYQTASTSWPRSRFVLILGSIIFIAGLTVGVYFSNLHDREEAVDADSAEYAIGIVGAYGSEEGTLQLGAFLSDPNLSAIGPSVSGNPAKVAVYLPDGSSFAQYYPSKGSFESGGIGATEEVHINVDMGGGRFVPGRLEVTVVEA